MENEDTVDVRERYNPIIKIAPAILTMSIFMAVFVYSDGLYRWDMTGLFITMVSGVSVASFIVSKPDQFSYFVVRALAVVLFFITFFGVCFSILFYESLPFDDPSKLREAQVFMAVSSSGMMGGLMRYFSHDKVIKDEAINLWHMVHAAIVGLFVSVVLFLILRAGIINQTQIDTFNVWGVTGVSAITGFFSERVIERFSNLYNEVVGNTKKQSESS
ncbi:hypothetical protein EXT48_02650 [Pseudoalteromonas sp. CO348]|uniref:YEATS-associated helix-containing protein n=1 Tax=Pseudoalteromonas sp. CO348 TaxID=1777271 RepID=UPI001022A6C9|nr:YEATS-associated helix-containing protein [Pseudoalteromonas sp. CO348]RZG09085.1 hypothetical protein EXT48_02650 [Pseudoalteromonas sp. CO348]